MPDVAVTVVGAGVVGLAIASELSTVRRPLVVLERNARHGQETSSRNSEVIHAGIYYEPGSLKARLCVEGKDLLYSLCAANDIPHRRITKIITATQEAELGEMELLARRGRENGVDLTLLTARQVRAREPEIATVGGILSPSTGIISAHALMDYLHHRATDQGAIVQTRCTVTALRRRPDGYEVEIDESGRRSTFTSEAVINAAGLEADTVAGMAGIDVDAAGYRLRYCKGSYFSVAGTLRASIRALVYPAPSRESLGVHALLDLAGRLRFGPDVEYLPDRNLDYTVDESKRGSFAESVRRILPCVRDEDLTPDMSGIRPKLQGPGEPQRDFIIREESGRGCAGLVNLIGIESPGLTAAPAIARHVRRLIGA